MQSKSSDMPKLTIDNRQVEVQTGVTILDAAEKLGIEIPTMCFLRGHKPSTSCMICVVRVEGIDSLVPACGTIAQEGMRIETNTEEIRQARITALELLLSDHVGDCMGPCQVACPAHMNISLMIRQIAAGKLRAAIETVKKDIALPAVLGRICPAPCENACRRRQHDKAVSICLLKRYAADVDLMSQQPFMSHTHPNIGKHVAIVGAGPAGLAAAYYLRRQGFGCTIYDEHDEPGGMLRYAVPEQKLPRDVLDKEIATIAALGVEFKLGQRVGTAVSMEKLCRDFDAVFVAVRQLKDGDAESLGLGAKSDCIETDTATYQTSVKGVFAGGDAVRRRRLTVRAVADGKEAAVSITQYLSGEQVTGPQKPFNSRMGKLKEGEMEIFLSGASDSIRIEPDGLDGGFSNEQAKREAQRCLHCDCRKPTSCKLRRYTQQYHAKAGKYKAERRTFVQNISHPNVIYEPGKCINCGLCVEIAGEAKEKIGLTFIGRGFEVRVEVPFDHSLAEGLARIAEECVAACPTGALAFAGDSEV